jgi:hypothetical protein
MEVVVVSQALIGMNWASGALLKNEHRKLLGQHIPKAQYIDVYN